MFFFLFINNFSDTFQFCSTWFIEILLEILQRKKCLVKCFRIYVWLKFFEGKHLNCWHRRNGKVFLSLQMIWFWNSDMSRKNFFQDITCQWLSFWQILKNCVFDENWEISMESEDWGAIDKFNYELFASKYPNLISS